MQITEMPKLHISQLVFEKKAARLLGIADMTKTMTAIARLDELHLKSLYAI